MHRATPVVAEADALCDRIGIMRDGNLVALGSAPQLKQRFGAGYTCSIATLPEAKAEQAVDEYMRATFPASRRLQESLAGRSKYEVCTQDVAAAGGLSAVLRGFAACETELHLSDWGISETTLEEVRECPDAPRGSAAHGASLRPPTPPRPLARRCRCLSSWLAAS